MGPQANRPIKALLTMEEILNDLHENEGATVTAVAERIDRPKSVVHDYLSTLEQLEYVVNDDGSYRLSLRWLDRGCKVRDRVSIYDLMIPELRRLAGELSNEMVSFAVEEEGSVVALEVIQSREDIEYETNAGMRFPIHCSGAGKAILAYQPEERIDSIIERHGLPEFTEKTITTREELVEELEEIRQNGVSYEYGEYHSGMATISAPILTPDDTPLGGISITGPERHMSEPEVKSTLSNKLLSKVNIIELNYSGRN
ncbi:MULTISPECIES: IclR family transcriptional regulator [Halostella]|uniref:IclR family transcriptional regulator n=1 Tax=Halostella TaxID=1843185 RepID=UPI0010800A22|nr:MULTISPECIES: IclR family transcriptional regulator [Halostella]